jgi:cytochrome c553
MHRGVVFGFLAVLAAATAASAQTSLERGRYLVDTVMTCHNCHTPKGPNGPQFDKARCLADCASTSPRST